MQLQHYDYNVIKYLDFKNLLTVSKLCQWKTKTRRLTTFPLIYKVLVFVLTLPISIATTK